jgi:hypothetical protein
MCRRLHGVTNLTTISVITPVKTSSLRIMEIKLHVNWKHGIGWVPYKQDLQEDVSV